MSSQHFSPDVSANRKAIKWSKKELFARLMWDILQYPLFAWTPRQIWIIRRLVLRAFGATIGKGVHLYPSVRIAVPWNLVVGERAAIGDHAILYSLGKIWIGDYATVSQYAHICAGSHDYSNIEMPLVKSEIQIGEGSWVCADAFIGPGASVGAGSIVGARSVVTNDVPEMMVVVGNPAQVLKQRPAKGGSASS